MISATALSEAGLSEDRSANSYTLSATAGAYTVTGASATFTVRRVLSAQPGAFTLTGTAATLRRGLSLYAAPGAYAVLGAAAEFTITAGQEVPHGGAGWYGKPNYLKWEERKNRRNKKKPEPPRLPKPQVQESLQAVMQKGRELSALDAEIQLLMELSLALQLDEEDAIALLLLAA